MRKFLASTVVFILTLFVFATPASAKVVTDQKGSVVISKNEVLDDDLFAGAQTVEIDGVVNGDVFVAAQTVRVTGKINGNLHVGANTLDLMGTVKGNVYAGAQSVLVSDATINGSLLVGAATVNLDKDTTVGGSVLTGAGALNLDSEIGRSLYAGVGNLTLGDEAVIGKDLYYAAGNKDGEVNISTKATVGGNTYKTEIDSRKADDQMMAAKQKVPAVMRAVRVTGSVISLIGALVVGFFYYKLFGKHLNQTESFINRSFWKSLGVGFLTTIAFIPGFIILLLTVIGVPVAFLALLILIIFAYLAKIVVGLALGNFISRKLKWNLPLYGSLVLGLFIIYVLRFIPAVGFLTGVLVLWIGLGSLVLGVFAKSE